MHTKLILVITFNSPISRKIKRYTLLIYSIYFSYSPKSIA